MIAILRRMFGWERPEAAAPLDGRAYAQAEFELRQKRRVRIRAALRYASAASKMAVEEWPSSSGSGREPLCGDLSIVDEVAFRQAYEEHMAGSK